MPTYQCQNCKRIKDFDEEYEYLLVSKKCIGCIKGDNVPVGDWHAYQGKMAPVVLDREEQQAEILGRRWQTCQAQIQTTEVARQEIEERYSKIKYSKDKESTAEIGKLLVEISLCNDVRLSLRNELGVLREELELLGNRGTIQKDANIVYEQAAQNKKLYVGSRQYVSQYASQTKQKKLRILDSNNWSWGLNLSWVEGGIDAGASFKLKLSKDNPYFDIPAKVLQALRERPNLSSKEFLALCEEEGSGSLLWYDKDGVSRPTWTAMEIAALLDHGYTFTFQARKSNKKEEKIILIP